MWRSERLLRKEVMDLYPGPMRLTQTRWVRIALLVGTGAWTVVFLLLAFPGVGDTDPEFSRQDQVVMGLIFAASGVFGVVRSGRELRRPHMLTMDANGFHVAAPGLDESYEWKDVDNFRVVYIARLQYVVCDVVGHDQPAGPRRGYDVRIRDNFGLPYEALASLMESWRHVALARGHSGSPARGFRGTGFTDDQRGATSIGDESPTA